MAVYLVHLVQIFCKCIINQLFSQKGIGFFDKKPFLPIKRGIFIQKDENIDWKTQKNHNVKPKLRF